MKYKHVKFTDEMFEMIKKESSATGINENSIIVIAVGEYLKKKERERK